LAVEHFGEKPLFWGRYFKSLLQASAYEYRRRTDRPTWGAIAAAAAEEGTVCGGLWVANYGGRPGCSPLPEWETDDVQPDDIDMPC